MADMLVRASVRGAARRAAGLRGGKRRLQDELNRTVRELGETAQRIYGHPPPVPTATGRSADLRDTGQALESVRAVIYYRAARVRATVTIDASRDGFNYLESMRFGQAADVIVSRSYGGRRGFMAAHVAGRGAPPVYLRRVRAFRPMVDFVEEAHLRFAPEVDREQERLARSIDTTFRASR